MLDFVAVACASAESEAVQESARGSIISQRRRGEDREAVGAGALHHAAGKRGADAHAL
jgi:hypothetical protein